MTQRSIPGTGPARRRARAIAMPAGSLPWMQPMTRTAARGCGALSSTAAIERRWTDRPRTDVCCATHPGTNTARSPGSHKERASDTRAAQDARARL